MNTDVDFESNNNIQTNVGHFHQYFTFILDKEEYGVNILDVLEIRGLEKITPIPSAPKFIKGVINLRGNIIPVMDLRERFNMESIPYNRATVLIIVQISNELYKKKIGLIVDAVSDVYNIDTEKVQSTPEYSNVALQAFISGLVPVKQGDQEKLVILLDVNKLINLNDLNSEVPVTDHEKH